MSEMKDSEKLWHSLVSIPDWTSIQLLANNLNKTLRLLKVPPGFTKKKNNTENRKESANILWQFSFHLRSSRKELNKTRYLLFLKTNFHKRTKKKTYLFCVLPSRGYQNPPEYQIEDPHPQSWKCHSPCPRRHLGRRVESRCSPHPSRGCNPTSLWSLEWWRRQSWCKNAIMKNRIFVKKLCNNFFIYLFSGCQTLLFLAKKMFYMCFPCATMPQFFSE